MKKPYTSQSRFKTELFLSVVTLLLVAVLCLVFQHLVVKKLSKATAQIHPAQHIFVPDRFRPVNEKLAFDREAPLPPEVPIDHKRVVGD